MGTNSESHCKLQKTSLFLKLYLFICDYTCHTTPVEARGQLDGTGFLLPGSGLIASICTCLSLVYFLIILQFHHTHWASVYVCVVVFTY